MNERRQLPRWEIKKSSRVWMPQVQSFSQGFIEDMHLKGMCISFEKPVFQQETVNIYFTIGEDNLDLIKVEAQVPWTKQEADRCVYGLFFSQIRDDYKDRISEYINTNCFDQIRNNWWQQSA
ncbi:MAG: PilZ domain-containing protein [Candidatus Omnitrophica bacterium]|nr:PilZ domain-containing protein [Candidatus Omnitrophota bacterium]MDE2221711.1 PilZ domain-containing protein [Candidatus Omnitrophota bacterium]